MTGVQTCALPIYLFEIEPGDSLLLMADKKRGIAIVGFDGMIDFMDESIRQARMAQQKQEEKK